MESVDFEALKKELSEQLNREVSDYDVLSYVLYPKVFLDFEQFRNQFGDVSVLDTPTFFYGLRLGEEIEVEIETGKTLIVKLVSISKARNDGTRIVYFEFNGQPREVIIKDLSVETETVHRPKADKNNRFQIGATMPGTVVKTLVSKGDKVKKGDHLLITEAMKMETTVQAQFDAVVKEVYVKDGEPIATGDLLIELEEE